jgi:hypothetical protein
MVLQEEQKMPTNSPEYQRNYMRERRQGQLAPVSFNGEKIRIHAADLKKKLFEHSEVLLKEMLPGDSIKISMEIVKYEKAR